MNKTFTLGRRRTVGYASGIITESLIYNMFFTYYLVFLTDVAKLNPALAGTVFLISTIFDAVADPVIGYISDKPKADKRKFLARALLPLTAAIIAAFAVLPGQTDTVKFVYYLIVTIVFWLSYTSYTIPYYAVAAEITQDYDERTRIRSLSSAINSGAIFMGNILPAVLPAVFLELGLSASSGWLPTVVLLAALSLVFGIVTVNSLKNAQLYRQPTPQARFSFFKTMLSIMKLRPFKGFTVFVFFYLIASSMMQANIVYMIVNCLGLSRDYMALVVGVLVVVMLVFIPIITKIAEKRDRRTACLIMFSLMFAGLITVYIFGVHSIGMLVAEAVTMAVGTAAFWTLFYSISYDLVEVDEFTNGVRREGAITAIPQFIQKFGSAVGVWLVGLILSFYGYNSDLPAQSGNTLQGIQNIGTIIPAAFLLVSIFGLVIYPVTKRRFEKLQTALNRKRAGESYSEEGFEPLVSAKTRRAVQNR